MRTKKSIKNAFFALFSNLLIIVLGVISQAFFLKTLGSEYLGLNSLFTNIISMLCIAELGIGNAIVFYLYKPLHENNIRLINSLMNFYKNAYRVVALIIFIIGILFLPFLHLFIGNSNLDINIYLVFLLFLLDACVSYLLCYKRSILYADQKNFIINIVHLMCVLLMNIIQIVILVLYKNFIVYLLIKIFFRFLENLLISYYVNKNYSYLLNNNFEKLDVKILDDIKKKVKALFVHQIGAFCVNGTDNLIISKFLGLTCVGLYSNYYLIINSISNLFSQTFSAVTSSVGNLLVSENKKKSLMVFKKINFINLWFSSFTMVCLFVLMDDFICIWIGEEFLLSKSILLVLCINYFLQTMKRSVTIFKEAAGIFYEDRFVPFLESGINLVVSIILVHWFGLVGVFIGTLLSVCVLHFYSYPKYVYNGLFNENKLDYCLLTVRNIFISLVVLFICTAIISLFNSVDSLMVRFILKFFTVIILPNLLLLLMFFKTNIFKECLNYIKIVLDKKKGV